MDDFIPIINKTHGKAIVKESLNKKIKKLVPDVNTVTKSKFSIINLDEESMYDKIFETFTDINIEKAEKVYSLLTKISQDMKKGKIDDNKLEKAMNALGLDVTEANPFLSKAKSKENDEDDSDSDDEDEKVKAAAKKIAEKVQKEEFGKGKNSDESEEDEEDEDDEMEKSKASEKLGGNKGLFLLFSKEIQKAKAQNTVENRALGVLIKSTLEENQMLKGHLENQNEIFKAQTEMIENQNELIKGLVEKIESFGAVPEPRKSITKGFTEKFPEQIEKGQNTNVLSISKNKNQIVELLDQKTFAKGFDEEFSKATTSFEASNALPANIIARLRTEHGITITE